MKRLSIAALAVLAAAAAGCGSSSSTTSQTKSSAPAVSSSGSVSVKSSALGPIVVDGSGRTLYMFAKDTAGKSNCSGSCASIWPPFATTGAPSAGKGVTASKLTVIMRPDGSRQVVYAGHPLYRYSGDSSAGSVSGQNLNTFGSTWHVLSGSGQPVTKAASASGSSSSGGGNATPAYP